MATTARTVRKDVLRNRALLLESADSLIREHGMDLSLNAVAHKAGVGVGTVYRHFPDREALIQALFEQRVERVRAILAAHADADDPVEALLAAVLEIGDTQAADRGIWEVLSSGSREKHRDFVRANLVPLADRLVRRANKTGRLRAEFATTDLPVLLWAGGALSAYLGPASATAWRRYVRMVLDSFLRDDDPARAIVQEPALTVDEFDAAMQKWHPRRITAG